MQKKINSHSLRVLILTLSLIVPINANAFELVPDAQIPQGETLQLIIPKFDFTAIEGNYDGKPVPFYEITQTIDESETITRAEFMQLIKQNKEYKDTVQNEAFFKDVPEESAFYTSIQEAAQNKIISGYEDGLFHPFEKITRGQAAKIIMNAYNPKQIIDEVTLFPDVPDDYSLKDYMYSAVKAGVFKGYPDGLMRPDRNISFFESGLIIQRAAKLTVTNIIKERQAYRAFLGIHRLSATGNKTLSVTAKNLSGETMPDNSTVLVTKQNFSTSGFSLAADKSALLGKDYQDNTWQLIDAAKANATDVQLWEGGFITPTEGEISLTYGEKLYINGIYSGSHFGIDYANNEGTPVFASNNGTVVLATETPSYGNTIVIDHGQNIYTMYLHLNELSVKTGDTVKKSDKIGLMGQTGVATGPHLHFTNFVGDIIVDSEPWFNGDFKQ
jgi:murein DD-endopeptidase MepM/ murein hydrolase activator NlpD